MKKVILGATGSIGSSLAKKLIESGDQVHLVGRDEESISSLANELDSSYTTCDVLEENFSDKNLDKEFLTGYSNNTINASILVLSLL